MRIYDNILPHLLIKTSLVWLVWSAGLVRLVWSSWSDLAGLVLTLLKVLGCDMIFIMNLWRWVRLRTYINKAQGLQENWLYFNCCTVLYGTVYWRTSQCTNRTGYQREVLYTLHIRWNSPTPVHLTYKAEFTTTTPPKFFMYLLEIGPLEKTSLL